MKKDQLMTIDDLSTYLKVSTLSIRHWITKEGLPGIKVGKLWRFDPTQIAQWLKDRTVNLKCE